MTTTSDGRLLTREDALQVVARYSVNHPEPGEKYRVVRLGDVWYAQWKGWKAKKWSTLDARLCREYCGGTTWHLLTAEEASHLRGSYPVTDPSITMGSGLPKPFIIPSGANSLNSLDSRN